jgi:hypothetical protein
MIHEMPRPVPAGDAIARIVSPTGHAHHLTNESSLPDMHREA